jgi:AraC family transcriptional activator of pobA
MVRSGGRAAIQRIDFHRTKYGPELLVDVEWIHAMPGFILDRPHLLTFYDVTLVTGGRGELRLDDRRLEVRPDTVFFSSPGQVRHWSVTGLDGICLFFPELFLHEFFLDHTFLERLPYFHEASHASLALGSTAARGLREALEAMHREVHDRRPDSVHILRARLYETLVTLARDFAARHQGGGPKAAPELVRRFRQLLSEHVARRHRVADCAQELGVTPGHLNAVCRTQVGQSAKSMIQEQLLLHARRLLLYTESDVEAIGEVLGFADPSYFARFFRRLSGRTPSAFRAQSRLVQEMRDQRVRKRRA